MRYLSMLCALLVVPSIAAADPAFVIRPLDHSATVTLARAAQRSAHVRALLAELGETDVIVHLEMSRQLPGGIGGTTRFISSRGGYRYLRISIASDLRPEARIAMLGHELQHALEIARSRARDVATLRRFLHQQGYRINGSYFETDAARAVELAVRRELRASEAEPVVELHHQHLRSRGAKTAAQVAKR